MYESGNVKSAKLMRFASETQWFFYYHLYKGRTHFFIETIAKHKSWSMRIHCESSRKHIFIDCFLVPECVSSDG